MAHTHRVLLNSGQLEEENNPFSPSSEAIDDLVAVASLPVVLLVVLNELLDRFWRLIPDDRPCFELASFQNECWLDGKNSEIAACEFDRIEVGDVNGRDFSSSCVFAVFWERFFVEFPDFNEFYSRGLWCVETHLVSVWIR
jgi:hypothetical protein